MTRGRTKTKREEEALKLTYIRREPSPLSYTLASHSTITISSIHSSILSSNFPSLDFHYPHTTVIMKASIFAAAAAMVGAASASNAVVINSCQSAIYVQSFPYGGAAPGPLTTVQPGQSFSETLQNSGSVRCFPPRLIGSFGR